MRRALSLIISWLLLLPTSVFAAGFGLDEAAKRAGYEISGKSISGTINGIIGAAFSLIGIVFLAMMLYGGYNWMSSMGEEEKVETGKKTIIWATIGLVIVLGAYAITYFVIEKLGS